MGLVPTTGADPRPWVGLSSTETPVALAATPLPTPEAHTIIFHVENPIPTAFITLYTIPWIGLSSTETHSSTNCHPLQPNPPI